MVINITKNGSMIELFCKEHEAPVKYDCKEKKIYSFTGREVKRLPPCANKSSYFATRTNIDYVINYVLDAIKGISWHYSLEAIEPYLPYANLIDSDFPHECPKGYINYVLKNNLRFNRKSFNAFQDYCLIKNLSKDDKEFYTWFTRMLNGHNYRLDNIITKETIVPYIKIMRVSVKRFYFDFRSEFREFCNACHMVGTDWIKIANTERDISFNAKEIKDYCDRAKNERIRKTERKIDFLQELDFGDFIVKVPQSIEDLQDEGKQQSNCVGHYYNDKITAGVDIIYFVRKKENPSKSHMTCRYNVENGRTVEYRFQFNNAVGSNTAEGELVRVIDALIYDELRKEG